MVKLSPGFSFKLIPILSFGIALLGLYLSSIFSYILFHSLVEIISIVIGYNIFILAWNSRNRLDNNYLLFLGIAYLFVCSLDLTHTLAYKGMGVFAGYDANLPTQLWIAARYLQSITLLICPVFLYRKINIQAVIWGYGAVSTALLVAIFMGFFPVCFVEGTGLTPFKIASEYVIILILLVAVVMLVRNRDSFDAEVLRWLVFSLILAISAEAAFTSYISVYGFANLTGHLLKLGSVYFIYKAIIKTGLEEPHRLFFRNLQQNETELKNAQHYAHLGSWTWNIKNDQLEWSDEMFHIFGLERETIPDLSPTVIKNFVHPDDRDKVKQSFQDAARNIFPVPFEFRVVWPDQSLHVVWAEVGELKVGADGKPAQLSGTVQDITERKRLENELLRSEQDLNEAQAIAHIGSWKWDVNNRKVSWSDEMYRIFGIDKNTFNGRLGDIARNAMHPDDLYIVLPENAANIANLPFEYRIILPDGSIRLIGRRQEIRFTTRKASLHT